MTEEQRYRITLLESVSSAVVIRHCCTTLNKDKLNNAVKGPEADIYIHRTLKRN